MARILVVEDEALVSMLITEVMEMNGHEVVAVCDTAEDAMGAATEHQTDLALVDIGLKGSLDGITVGEYLDSRNVPVVFLTGRMDRALLEGRGFAADMLQKPFNVAELSRVVARVLANGR